MSDGTITAIIGQALPIGVLSIIAIALLAITEVTRPDKPEEAIADALSSFANPLIVDLIAKIKDSAITISWGPWALAALLPGVLEWEVLLKAKSAWDTLIWFFASTTAHITAFFAAGVALDAPAMPLALLLAFLSSPMMSLSHNATGTAPIIFGSGYTTLNERWVAGVVLSVVTLCSSWWRWAASGGSCSGISKASGAARRAAAGLLWRSR